MTYVVAVCPVIAVHDVKAVVVHLSHWYVKVIGWDPVHVPFPAVSVRPTRTVPVIVGTAVFRGGARYVAV